MESTETNDIDSILSTFAPCTEETPDIGSVLATFTPYAESSDSDDGEEQGYDPKTLQKLLTRYTVFQKPFIDATNAKVGDPTKRLDTPLLWYVKYLIFYRIHGIIAKPTPGDSDETLAYKAEISHMYNQYNYFLEEIEKLYEAINAKIRDAIAKAARGTNSALIQVLDDVLAHKEVHVRRLKQSPSKVRTKMDVGKTQDAVCHAVTGELCDFAKKQGGKLVIEPSSLRWLIVYPQPSDYDEDAIDDNEGGEDHKRAKMAEFLMNRGTAGKEPFGFVVSPEWADQIMFLHNLRYFNEYTQIWINQPPMVSDMFSKLRTMSWKDAWIYLTGAYANKSCSRFARNRHKVHTLVWRITELRDIVRTAIKMHNYL